LEDGLLVVSFSAFVLHKHGANPACTKFLFVNTKTGFPISHIFLTCVGKIEKKIDWACTDRILNFAYNSVSNKFLMLTIPANEILHTMVEWDVNCDTMTCLKSEYRDMNVASFFRYDKEEVFYKKECWASDDASKFKNKFAISSSL
jgi:hypothetical protein